MVGNGKGEKGEVGVGAGEGRGGSMVVDYKL